MIFSTEGAAVMPVEKTDIHVVVIGHVDSAEKPLSTAPVINKCQGDRIETL